MASSASSANVMLAIYEKKTTGIDLYRSLKQYVSVHFSERQAQDVDEDLQTVKQMRNDLEKSVDSLDARRDLLQKYIRAMESRFPITPDRDHVNTLTFTWYDAFKHSKKASQQNIHFEKAGVLFNLAAIHSQIALSADRTTPMGLKQACNSFQASAGVFAFLRDNASMKAVLGPSTVDIMVECTGMLERLMLAQAQECFFEKVIADGKPPGLFAKVSRQVGLYYEEAYNALNLPPLNQHIDKAWASHVQLKAAHFFAEACYRCGLDLHDKEEIAEEIARLQRGITALTDVKKTSKGVASSLIDAINRLETSLNHNLERAMKENDRVYLMRVPPASSLSPLQSASLVNPTAMDDVFDASKEKFFAGLVPDSSAKALSRYTEMVDEIIRTHAEKLQQGSELTRVKLKEMDLPDSILALEGNFSLPHDIKDDVEAVQICGGPSGLEAELQQLKDLRRVNEEMLVHTEELLQKEASEDAQFRTQFGTRWTRLQSSTLTKNLSDRLNRFAGNLKQAAESDTRIERAIESALPNLARPIMSLDGNEDAVVGTLKQSLRQLETLGAQRAVLEDMLKDMKRQEQNDKFAAIFNLEDYRAAREKSYRQIAAAVAKFREIKENINEGLKFYVTLQDAIKNIKQQCSDFVMTRNIQCQEMMDDVQRQVAGLRFTEQKPSFSYPPTEQFSQRNGQLGEPQNPPHPSMPQPPYYRAGNQSTTGFMFPSGPGPTQPPPPHAPQSPYHVQQPPQPSQQQSNLEYGHPAYAGWRAPYHGSQVQPTPNPPPPASGAPRPPYYNSQRPYPPQQGGPYYRNQ